LEDYGISWYAHDPNVVLTHLAIATDDGADYLVDFADFWYEPIFNASNRTVTGVLRVFSSGVLVLVLVLVLVRHRQAGQRIGSGGERRRRPTVSQRVGRGAR
jgi:hypothetical protein